MSRVYLIKRLERQEAPVENLDAHIPLSHAILCATCEQVYRVERATCPACDADTGLPLARVLDRRAS